MAVPKGRHLRCRSTEELVRDDRRNTELRRTIETIRILQESENRAKYRSFLRRWGMSRLALENQMGPRVLTVTIDWTIIRTTLPASQN